MSRLAAPGNPAFSVILQLMTKLKISTAMQKSIQNKPNAAKALAIARACASSLALANIRNGDGLENMPYPFRKILLGMPPSGLSA